MLPAFLVIEAQKGPCTHGTLLLFRSAMPNTSTSHPSLLEKTIERFLFHSQYEKNLSEKTLKAYATDLRQFAGFMMNQRNICHLPAISAEDLKQYVKSLSGFQPRTMKRKMATLKAMLNFIEMEDDDFINPMRKLKINIKVPFLLPPVMDSMEVSSILTTLYRGEKRLFKQNRVSLSGNRPQHCRGGTPVRHGHPGIRTMRSAPCVRKPP